MQQQKWLVLAILVFSCLGAITGMIKGAIECKEAKSAVTAKGTDS
jgi:hypothetical protein